VKSSCALRLCILEEMSAVAQRVVGRYLLFDEFAAGGMATVHLGRLLGPVGFTRTVAIKRLHPQYAKDPDFSAMFIDEARLASRIQHGNVVQTIDVANVGGELFLVMEYVHGESFSKLLRHVRQAGDRPPPPIVAAILSGILHGLHAAHEATDEHGRSLGVVHRDVSPQNILVGTDGVPRVLDFGVAKTTGRLHATRDGQLKGKLAYMPPEQLSGHVSRQTDVYASAVVLWEALVGRRLFPANDEREIVSKILFATVQPPSDVSPGLDPALDEVVLRGLSRNIGLRYATTRDMAAALEERIGLATAAQVGHWVERNADEALKTRRELVRILETLPSIELPGRENGVTSDALSASRSAPSAATAYTNDDPSSVSIATTHGRPEARSRRTRALLSIGALVLFLAGAASATVLVRSRRAAEPTTLASSALAGAAVASEPLSSGAEPILRAWAPTPADPVYSAYPRPPAASHRAPAPRASASGARQAMDAVPATVPSGSPAKPNCDPPYRLGPRGEKLWVVECL
jgi:serine/threonine protein kinase